MTLLEEADQIINGQRRTDYGDAKACFNRIATFWNTYLGGRCDKELSPYDVANMMILFKVARDAHKPGHRDNFLDIIGYAALTEVLSKEEANLPTGQPIC